MFLVYCSVNVSTLIWYSRLFLCYAASLFSFSFFFFNDTATTEIYTLSLHDALPIYHLGVVTGVDVGGVLAAAEEVVRPARRDRKSTRLNSSHTVISYAVFCLKKKKKKINKRRIDETT